VDEPVNLDEYEAAARAVLPAQAYDYYRGSSDAEKCWVSLTTLLIKN
jgi:hypothetical protein